MNAFVTGGSRGIGRAIVLKMVEEGYGCGFTYISNDSKAEETIRLAKESAEKSGKEAEVRAYKVDVKDASAVETTAEQAIADFEDIGILVNNAALVKNNAAALMSDSEWDDVIATNLSGPFYMIRSFLMHFISNRYGRIINISSLAQDGCSGQVNYAASKAGLIGLTKTLSREYGPKGVTSNVVAVGYVLTDMTGDHLQDELHEIWLDYCPLRRIGTAEEIAGMVHYLTTKNGAFINGEVIRVAGGLSYIP
jgi:3-oxoacyl-[acyl-carrier protein] reductase